MCNMGQNLKQSNACNCMTLALLFSYNVRKADTRCYEKLLILDKSSDIPFEVDE